MVSTRVPQTFEEWRSMPVVSSQPANFPLGTCLLTGRIGAASEPSFYDSSYTVFSITVTHPDGTYSSGFRLQLKTGGVSDASGLGRKVRDALGSPAAQSLDCVVGVRVWRSAQFPSRTVNYLRLPGLCEAVVASKKVVLYSPLA